MVKSGVAPNSVMLASTGTLTAALNCFVLRQLGHGLREDHVRAGLDTGQGALDGGVHALDRERIGAGHDDEIIGAGIHGGLDAVHHLGLGDDRLAGAMTAALGRDLILDMTAGGAGTDQSA